MWSALIFLVHLVSRACQAFAGASAADSTSLLPPRPEKRPTQRGGSPPTSHRSDNPRSPVDCTNRANPKVVPRHGQVIFISSGFI
ncbi:hypothetical protein TSMEX_010325 [Taenia solium]|eukprot:TsM_000285100 transcript=TsM_000285100 gene=TsM_000285100